MEFKRLRYKSLVWGLSALAFCSTSCKDFLDVDVYDQYSTEAVSSFDDCLLMTRPLYGGRLWTEYESKFAWCVNEGVPGVLYNVHQEEGALFLLSIGEDNPILKEGYTSLYSGVISTANQIIDKVSSLETSATLTKEQKDQVVAEARLFRAYAHFLATEYFGEAPLILNTAADLNDNIQVPRVSRRTLYAAIEKDLKYAEKKLAERPSDNWRVSKYSAKALLAKLYLTMGSCVADLPGAKYPFKVSESESKDYMKKAADLCTDVIKHSGAALTTHEDIFSFAGRNTPSTETIFAIYWPMGEYGEGSAYQSQMAPEEIWSPGSGWGGGKGISYTIYNSFNSKDARKKELCFFVDQEYTTISRERVYYGPKYSEYTEKNDHVKAGDEFLNGGQCLLNNVKKYIWGVNGTATNEKGMATDRRQDVIRLSDVYMMRAEANMALENLDVTAKLTVGVDDINKVLKAHNAPQLDESAIAFFDNMENMAIKDPVKFTVQTDEGAVEVDVPVENPMYHQLIRKDLVQQRRKEFAMEGQAWLDLKRFFYRDPAMAEKFMYQMDRGIQFSQSPEVEDNAMFQSEEGYARRQLVHDLNVILAGMYPDKDYTAGNEESPVNVESFIQNNQWYLPIPTSAKTYLQKDVQDLYNKVMDDKYPY